jgi:hypothetical protein
MTILNRFLFLLSAVLFSFTSLLAQGYHIEVELKGLSNDTVILGEYFTSRMVPKDTILVDQNGRGSFAGTEKFSGGLYLVYIDPVHYFDFLLGDDQELTISADTTDLAGSITFRG